jgi:hypothetical protein
VPNGVGVRLARNRRSPKRPSEPRLSGVHPEEDAVTKDAQAPIFSAGSRQDLGEVSFYVARWIWLVLEHIKIVSLRETLQGSIVTTFETGSVLTKLHFRVQSSAAVSVGVTLFGR